MTQGKQVEAGAEHSPPIGEPGAAVTGPSEPEANESSNVAAFRRAVPSSIRNRLRRPEPPAGMKRALVSLPVEINDD